jgi:O-Antigen ligase
MLVALIALIFLSKVSLAFVPGFPRELFPIFYQSGLHPYSNIAGTLVLGLLLFFFQRGRLQEFGSNLSTQHYVFRIFISALAAYLVLMTAFQDAFYLERNESLYAWLAAGLAIFMVFIFGREIPRQMKAESFIDMVKGWSVFLCWASLLALLVFPETSFKGGRFIGVFKHIPHMVSVATLACVFAQIDLFARPISRRRFIFTWLSVAVAFFLLVLTGTRSALAAVMASFGLSFVLITVSNPAVRLFKASLALSGLLFGLFFGPQIVDYAIGIVRGQQSIGLRAAQDGVASRWEEIERGYQTFKRQEWVGHGLMNKFSRSEEDGPSGYDASQDPHNVFVSAGVVGGWGLVALTAAGLLLLLIATARKLTSSDVGLRLLAIYCVTQLPVIFIYHVHLSMGGIADRIYWIVFGYMALVQIDNGRAKNEKVV